MLLIDSFIHSFIRLLTTRSASSMDMGLGRLAAMYLYVSADVTWLGTAAVADAVGVAIIVIGLCGCFCICTPKPVGACAAAVCACACAAVGLRAMAKVSLMERCITLMEAMRCCSCAICDRKAFRLPKISAF